MVTVIDQIGQTGTTLNTYVNPCLTTLAKQRQLHETEKNHPYFKNYAWTSNAGELKLLVLCVHRVKLALFFNV